LVGQRPAQVKVFSGPSNWAGCRQSEIRQGRENIAPAAGPGWRCRALVARARLGGRL